MRKNVTVKKVVGFAVALGLAVSVNAQQLVYITENNKIGEIANAANPSVITGPFNITGLPAGQVIEGIDYRPLTGELYGFGYNPSTQEAQLFVISQTTAFATAIGAPYQLDLVPGKIGFDFNPTVDRIRLTSSNGGNYRVHPTTGALVATDGNLAFDGNDVNAGVTPNIIASAYTRSYIGSETSSLYNIDFGLNTLTLQTAPNVGVLSTVGGLNLAFHVPNATVGFDFFFDGNSSADKAFVSANTNNAFDSLYTLDVSTGSLTNLGQIGNGFAVRDIAAVIKRNLPAVTGVEAYGLTGLGNLIMFDTDRPELIRSLVPISGITVGQTLLGMDFRPANGELYAMGYDRPFSQYQLYTINVNNGVATAVNNTPIGIELDTAIAAFDFNPVADRIRVVGAGRENYRINPDNGALVGVDANVAYAAGDANAGQAPFIASVAYDNNYMGALSTSLIAYDQQLNVFSSMALAPSNVGQLSTIANSGLVAGGVSLDTYFDLASDQNWTFCAANGLSSNFDDLYIVQNNVFSSVGRIGFGVPVKDIALVIGDAPANLDINESTSINTVVGVYPNPAVDIIQVKVNNMSNQLFMINDMTGRTLYSGVMNTDVKTLDVSSFGSGVYFVVFEDGTTVKWIKR